MQERDKLKGKIHVRQPLLLYSSIVFIALFTSSLSHSPQVNVWAGKEVTEASPGIRCPSEGKSQEEETLRKYIGYSFFLSSVCLNHNPQVSVWTGDR